MNIYRFVKKRQSQIFKKNDKFKKIKFKKIKFLKNKNIGV